MGPFDFLSGLGSDAGAPFNDPNMLPQQGAADPGNMPFAPMPQSGAVGDPLSVFAKHLASQGIGPDQFMKTSPAAQPPTGDGSLGSSLVPLPTPSPAPKFGGPGMDANASADTTQPRGIRNNNPLNIEDGPFAQAQPGYKGSDGRFAQFETPEHGTSAAKSLFDTYQNKYGINTVNGIVGRWAPASDGNDVNAYSSYVAKKLGIDPNSPVPPERQDELVQAMSEFENGKAGAGGDKSKKSVGPAPTSSNDPTTAFGKRLQETLAGVKAPAAPTPQRLYSPSVPHATSNLKSGQLAALLASIVPQQPAQTHPLYLTNLLKG